MPGHIRRQFDAYGVNPAMICFEITETAVIANLDKAQQFIAHLRALGCRFSLDDFGSGLSSFAYLRSLRVDYLKIDGVFVRDIAVNSINHALVRAIITHRVMRWANHVPCCMPEPGRRAASSDFPGNCCYPAVLKTQGC